MSSIDAFDKNRKIIHPRTTFQISHSINKGTTTEKKIKKKKQMNELNLIYNQEILR